MRPVMRILAAIGRSLPVKSVAAALALYATAALLALLALQFALLAAFFALAPAWGEVQAASLIALGVAAAALVCAGIAVFKMRQARRRAALLAAAAPVAAAGLPAAAGLVKRSPALLALSILAAGFLATRR